MGTFEGSDLRVFIIIRSGSKSYLLIWLSHLLVFNLMLTLAESPT